MLLSEMKPEDVKVGMKLWYFDGVTDGVITEIDYNHGYELGEKYRSQPKYKIKFDTPRDHDNRRPFDNAHTWWHNGLDRLSFRVVDYPF